MRIGLFFDDLLGWHGGSEMAGLMYECLAGSPRTRSSSSLSVDAIPFPGELAARLSISHDGTCLAATAWALKVDMSPGIS
jgi:hypothetical protein